VRHDNPALQRNDTLKLLHIDNENLLAYMKTSEDDDNVVICVVNLDPYNTQGGTLQVPWWELGMEKEEAYQMHDMLDSAYYNWRGEWNYVQLNPHVLPAHVFALKRTSHPAVENPSSL
jgi:starch synthase (maltosyl-transferring)